MRPEEGERGPRVTDAMIARRAFEISLTDDTGSAEENWLRAKQELCEEAAREAARRS